MIVSDDMIRRYMETRRAELEAGARQQERMAALVEENERLRGLARNAANLIGTVLYAIETGTKLGHFDSINLRAWYNAYKQHEAAGLVEPVETLIDED